MEDRSVHRCVRSSVCTFVRLYSSPSILFLFPPSCCSLIKSRVLASWRRWFSTRSL